MERRISKTLLLLITFSSVSAFLPTMDAMREEWELFKTKYNKEYDTLMEDVFRMDLFLKSKNEVDEHNREYFEGKQSYLMETNVFSDMMPKEISRRSGYAEADPNIKEKGVTFIRPPKDVIIPDAIDWREKGAVTPAKDQGHCGSCWAFASTGGLEGMHFRKTGKLVSLSEQNLIDCIPDIGCEGGIYELAYTYINLYGGIDTEESYPYKAINGECHFDVSAIGATDKGYVLVQQRNQEALKEAVALKGPIVAYINANVTSFRGYASGVYDNPECRSVPINHTVLVVGYGTSEKGEDYWIVKNSWGKSWGMDGYIYIARDERNVCGVLDRPGYPLV